MAEYPVIVRTWPEYTGVRVVDSVTGSEVIDYRLDLAADADNVLHDIEASFTDRARVALEHLQADQVHLQGVYNVPRGEKVSLKLVTFVREEMEVTLERHGILDLATSIRQTPNLIRRLDSMPINKLYDLVLDWSDLIQDQPPGTARNSDSLLARFGHPESCVFNRYLAAGLEDPEKSTAATDDAGYQLFQRMLDYDVNGYSLGALLHWSYFHRVEFPDRGRFKIPAWDLLLPNDPLAVSP